MTHRHRLRGLIADPILVPAALLLVLIVATFYAGVFHEGRRAAKAQQSALLAQQRKADQAVDKLRAERDDTERDLRKQIADQKAQLETTQGAANASHQTHVAGVRAGTVRVRVPIVPAMPASCGPAQRGPAQGGAAGPETAYAQLDPTAAANLADIAHDGDQGIRELNYCIDRYELMRKAMDRWTEQTLAGMGG
ncbi:DUF2514 family protein [Delftia tsuruhatensis]|uniref:DUF2514 family protein n=1 Tax=Delftia lacustris TaxID=558537 RepID=A0A7T2YZ59_9BURK|nr:MULTISPECIES: DUF2514 family protein [Delftia]QPS84475.1 DUF2514 family protein [Delftia lacustris]TDF23666.1 DUF2514 family protein [Delftia tsuruhatensis]